MTLQEDVWQGKYGEDLVRAMASAAGLVISRRDIDVDGVDINVGYPGKRKGKGYPAIEIQVKTWKVPMVINGELSYPLDAKNYNQLVGFPPDDFPVPRFFFLVVVPSSSDLYVSRCGEHYSFSEAIYWKSLMEDPELPEGRSSKTVRLPLGNLVTTTTLLELIELPYPMRSAT